MHICAGLVGPTSGKVLPAAARNTFIDVKRAARLPKTICSRARRRGFGSFWRYFAVTLGSVWLTLGHLMVTSQSLWSHLGYIKVVFKNTHIFHVGFHDFIKLLDEMWVDLGVALGAFLGT